MTIERIQIRRGTAAQWAAADPVLSSGEFGLDTDAGRVRLGDGSLAWSALDWFGGVTPEDLKVLPGEANTAIGVDAHASGNSCSASGDYSHAEGFSTDAIGQNSHAEGNQTTASGVSSHAEGEATASGDVSHAEGFSTASGNYSHAEGAGTTASGNRSHAEGETTTASGLTSHAQGSGSKAAGDVSHAEGWFTEANNDYTHVEGIYANAFRYGEHAEGSFLGGGVSGIQKSRVLLRPESAGATTNPILIPIHAGPCSGRVTILSNDGLIRWDLLISATNAAANYAGRATGTVTINSSSGGGSPAHGSSAITWAVTGNAFGQIVITPSASISNRRVLAELLEIGTVL